MSGGGGGYRGGQQDHGAKAKEVAVITPTAVVAMNPEVVEVAVEAEVAWVEVIKVASIILVALGTKDHITILNRIIQTTIPSFARPG